MTPVVRIPTGPITPHGAYHILHDKIPQMTLRSYDDTVVINMLGGLAIPDKYAAPERVEVVELKGLIPPWQVIDQKGATQDGVSFVDALYDPAEVELVVRIVGRDAAHAQWVFDKLCASLDAKRESELSFITHRMGRWWAKVRWFKAPVDTISNKIRSRSQVVSLRLRADSAFWQSYPDVNEFVFGYNNTEDLFGTDYAPDMGANWEIAYTGAGSGTLAVDDGEVISTLNNRRAVARRVSTVASTDNMVAEIELGRIGQWFFPTDASNEAWVRVNNTGTAGTHGIRLQVLRHKIRLSYFIAGAETLLREMSVTVPPKAGEKFRLIAGDGDKPRVFKVMRGSATIMTVTEIGTGSPVGAAYRSYAVGSASSGSTPAAGVRSFRGGINGTFNQSGFLERINVGEIERWDRYTCFGPGTFRIANGPGSADMVEFGPLLPNQVAQIRTDPRKRGVVDMTATPATPQEKQLYEKSLLDIFSFATGNNIPILGDALQSVFGFLGTGQKITPPQGNLYSLMKGRFSQPIPAKPAGGPLKKYYVKVEIVDGNADSKILAAGTPLRRYPI